MVEDCTRSALRKVRCGVGVGTEVKNPVGRFSGKRDGKDDTVAVIGCLRDPTTFPSSLRLN